MKGLKVIQATNFNCVFGKEKSTPMLREFKRIVYPAFKYGKKEYKNSIIKKFFFSDIKILDSNLGYCLYGKIIKDIDLVIKNKLDSLGNLIDVDDKVPSAPYSEFILILRNHKMIFTPSQNGSPTLFNFKTLINHSIRNIIKANDIREGKRLLNFNLDIFEIPEEVVLEQKLNKFDTIDYFKFEIQPQNARFFDHEYLENLEAQRKDIGADKIEQTIVKPSCIKKVKEIILSFKDMAYYTLKGKEKNKDWEIIKNSTYKKQIEHHFPEANSNETNILEAIRIAGQDKRIAEVDIENNCIYNEEIEEIKKLN